MLKAYLSMIFLFFTTALTASVGLAQGYFGAPAAPAGAGIYGAYQSPGTPYFGSGQYMTAPPCGYGGMAAVGIAKADEDDRITDAKDKIKDAQDEEKEVDLKALEGKGKLSEAKLQLKLVLKDRDADGFVDGLKLCETEFDSHVPPVQIDATTATGDIKNKPSSLAWCTNATSGVEVRTRFTTSTQPVTEKVKIEIPDSGSDDQKDLAACTSEAKKKYERPGVPFAPCYDGSGKDHAYDPGKLDKWKEDVKTYNQKIIVNDSSTQAKFDAGGFCVASGDHVNVSTAGSGNLGTCQTLAKKILQIAKDADDLTAKQQAAKEKLADLKSYLKDLQKLIAQEQKDDASLGITDTRFDSDATYAGCPQCQAYAKSQQQHPVLNAVLPAAVGVGAFVGGLLEQNAQSARNARLGYPVGPNPPPALQFPYPYAMSGFYGGVYGGMGSGGFGCSPTMGGGYFGGGPWGAGGMYGGGLAGGMYGGAGYPFGGGMYMPGQSPWGYNGPWGVGGGMYGGIGAGLPYGAPGVYPGIGAPGIPIGGGYGGGYGGYGGYPGIGLPGIGGYGGIGLGGGYGGYPGLGLPGVGGGLPGIPIGGGYGGGYGGYGGYPGLGLPGIGGIGGSLYGGIGLGGGYSPGLGLAGLYGGIGAGGIAGYPGGSVYGGGYPYGGVGGIGALGGLGGLGGYGGLGGGLGGYGGLGGGTYNYQIQQMIQMSDLQNRMARLQAIGSQINGLDTEAASAAYPGSSNLLGLPNNGTLGGLPSYYGGVPTYNR